MFPLLLTTFVFPLFRGISLLTSYITNSNIFPEPLSEKEEAELLARKDAGDEVARNMLVERNLRLVAHIVKKFDGTGEDTDDLISIGTIGLIKAINTFNKVKKTRLATYAARCIENEILMHLRATKKSKGEMLLYDPIGADKEGNEITLIDVLGTEADEVAAMVEGVMEETKLQEKIQNLSRREKRVIELRYGLTDGNRRTQREISKKLGISRSYVSRIEKRALNKLYREMVAEGYQ
ncbi:MAG TPA: RNA polymerase sporulation sigma factor SigK [Firmicutes bacterium]|nr:RNA polymerase sporulation sigma factor SigK [Bacillota bacterium]